MAMRGILGPVFASEWRASSRRWQGYALRSLLVSLLLVGLSAVWLARRVDGAEPSVHEMAEIGRAFYGSTAIILLGLVGLAAPAATAGSICVDKARGNLLLLFATDLTDVEIVLGKLAARLTPVLGLMACAAPVLTLSTLLGGVDPSMTAGAILVCLSCAVFGCTLALTLSVWGRKPHEVLLATYAFGILWLLSAPIWAFLSLSMPSWARPAWLPNSLALMPYNPVFLVLAPLDGPTGTPSIGLEEQARFCALGLTVSAALAVLATWRMRTVVVRQASQGERKPRAERPVRDRGGWFVGRLPSPSLDGNPVLWREWHRRRPSRWSVAVWGVYGLLSSGFSLLVIYNVLVSAGPSGGEGPAVLNGFQASVGLLLLSASAATSMAEERQRGSLDVLLSTPLSTRSIVLGKWWGALRGVLPLTMWPVLVSGVLASAPYGYTLAPALIGGLIFAYGAAITSLGLALAVWVPRMGRAVGLTTGAYLLVLIGALPAGMLLFGHSPTRDAFGFAAASPFWGVGFSCALFNESDLTRSGCGRHAAWLVFWMIGYLLVAFGLLIAVLCTFNRCLGRTDDRSTGSGAFPRTRP